MNEMFEYWKEVILGMYESIRRALLERKTDTSMQNMERMYMEFGGPAPVSVEVQKEEDEHGAFPGAI